MTADTATTVKLRHVARLVRAATGDEYGDGETVTEVGIGYAGGDPCAVWVAGDWNDTTRRVDADGDTPAHWETLDSTPPRHGPPRLPVGAEKTPQRATRARRTYPRGGDMTRYGVTEDYEYNEHHKRHRIILWSGPFRDVCEGSALSVRGGYMVTPYYGEKFRVTCPSPRDDDNFREVDAALDRALRAAEGVAP